MACLFCLFLPLLSHYRASTVAGMVHSRLALALGLLLASASAAHYHSEKLATRIKGLKMEDEKV